jgi:hypothetical protein
VERSELVSWVVKRGSGYEGVCVGGFSETFEVVRGAHESGRKIEKIDFGASCLHSEF